VVRLNIVVEGMNREQADCTALIQCTARVLNDKTLVASDQHLEDQELASLRDDQDQPDHQYEEQSANQLEDDKQNSPKVS